MTTTENRAATRSGTGPAAAAATPSRQVRPAMSRRGGRSLVSRGDGDGPGSALARARAAASPTEYLDALDLLRELKGMSFQEVSAGAGPHVLPKSTAHKLCRRTTLPKKPDQVRSFVIGCGEPGQADAWVEQWSRLRCAERRVERTAPSPEPEVAGLPPVPEAPPAAPRAEPVVAVEPGAKVSWWRRIVAGVLFTLVVCTLATVSVDRSEVRDLVMTAAGGAAGGVPIALFWRPRQNR